MTVFLTFGVYALKINGEMPTQSEFVPLVSVYFIVATIYTLVSLIWFVTANFFVIKSNIPKPLVFVAEKIQFIFFFDCISKKKNSSQKSPPPKVGSVESVYRSPIETINQPVNLNRRPKRDEEEDDSRSQKFIFIDELKRKCDSCPKPLCEGCDSKEKEKKNAKKAFDRNLRTLNLLAFFVVFLIMLISNLCIWLSIAN